MTMLRRRPPPSASVFCMSMIVEKEREIGLAADRAHTDTRGGAICDLLPRCSTVLGFWKSNRSTTRPGGGISRHISHIYTLWTEYIHPVNGSFFESTLTIVKRHGVCMTTTNSTRHLALEAYIHLARNYSPFCPRLSGHRSSGR